jgi:predicted nuclease with TOPRIM domain
MGSKPSASKDDVIFFQVKRNQLLEEELRKKNTENEDLKLALQQFEEKSVKGLEEVREWFNSLENENEQLHKRVKELETIQKSVNILEQSNSGTLHNNEITQPSGAVADDVQSENQEEPSLTCSDSTKLSQSRKTEWPIAV